MEPRKRDTRTQRTEQTQSTQQTQRTERMPRTQPGQREDPSEPREGSTIPPRLLPWPTEDGKPCYLVPNPHSDYLARLADEVEAEQLGTGADVLVLAQKVLDDVMSPHTEVRYAGIRLAECLSDVLRVAESRGRRLAALEAGAADAPRAAEPPAPAAPAPPASEPVPPAPASRPVLPPAKTRSRRSVDPTDPPRR